MSRSHQKTIPPVLQRYELKFVIPVDMIEPISDFASVYCSLDKYSAQTPDNFYRVNNLYFDTPDYLFLKRRLDGCENRFNMRIRTYSDNSPVPCFFEIKQKNVNIIKKYRARINNVHWPLLLEGLYGSDGALHGTGAQNGDLFIKMAYTYNAAPKVLSQYMRKAYVSDIDDYARVTFDTDLRSQAPDGYSLAPDESIMLPVDNSTIFDEGCNVVLELKCYTTQVPLWMIDLIRCFDLRRRSFSKYVTGVTSVLNMYSCDCLVRQTTAELSYEQLHDAAVSGATQNSAIS